MKIINGIRDVQLNDMMYGQLNIAHLFISMDTTNVILMDLLYCQEDITYYVPLS